MRHQEIQQISEDRTKPALILRSGLVGLLRRYLATKEDEKYTILVYSQVVDIITFVSPTDFWPREIKR